MQGIELRTRKKLSGPYVVPKSWGEEQTGSEGIEENENGSVEVQKPFPPYDVPKYIPKLSFLQKVTKKWQK